MRRIRYLAASSLDGYIAGPQGESDWITMDPEIDFAAIFQQFDTILMGRRTFEAAKLKGGAVMPGMKTIVLSRTLLQSEYPEVTVAGDRAEELLHELRSGPGKDIWLFGGGVLFRNLATAGLVDSVELAIMPVILGGGVPLVAPDLPKRLQLRLAGSQVYESGILSAEYDIQYR